MPQDSFTIWTAQERDTWLTLMRSTQQVNRRLASAMENEHQLPMAWYDVLVTLYQYGEADGLTMQTLASQIMMSGSGLTRLVDRMLQAGLLERRRGSDRRIVRVSLTPAGKAKIEEAMPAHQQRVQALFLSQLTPAEQVAFTTGCRRVLAQLEESEKTHV